MPGYTNRLIKSWGLPLLLVCCVYTPQAAARLEVCNQTDLVLMVAVGYNTSTDRIATEGWWRVYPGFCEIPVDVTLLAGSYYVHAESNPRSTMPGDAFSWGEQRPLCVRLADFRLPNSTVCRADDASVQFDQVGKNWRNSNVVNIFHSERKYDNIFRTRVAGVQRMLSIIGYDVGDIDGVIGEKTAEALNEIGSQNQVHGFDFSQVFPLLEATIAKQQKLDN